MDKIKLKALGKINLGLDVLGRRPNGYHDVRMVMQTVYLYDQILLEKTDKEGISLKTNLFYLPVNENNLAYRAAKMLIDEFAIKEGVHISLEKHIPVAAMMRMAGTNTAAILSAMRCTGAFEPCASSTARTTRASVESEPTRRARTISNSGMPMPKIFTETSFGPTDSLGEE